MKASIDSAGNVTIQYNSQTEQLAAPDYHGSPQIYLPCSVCGSLQAACSGTHRTLCDACHKQEINNHYERCLHNREQRRIVTNNSLLKNS